MPSERDLELAREFVSHWSDYDCENVGVDWDRLEDELAALLAKVRQEQHEAAAEAFLQLSPLVTTDPITAGWRPTCQRGPWAVRTAGTSGGGSSPTEKKTT